MYIYLVSFLDPSSQGTGMTGKEGYSDDKKEATRMTSLFLV
ncbi:hypothetical protein [Wolbachia pipientis]|nr:hypothetical protein [Wolbachia pipientis]